MDNLTLDAESLLAIADIIEGYCVAQCEIVSIYYTQIMTLESDWRDDETFGRIAEEINTIKNNIIEASEAIRSTYPEYFRKKAEYILERPTINGDHFNIVKTIEEANVSPHRSSFQSHNPIINSPDFSSTPVILLETKQVWKRNSDGMIYDSPIETGRTLDSNQGKVQGYSGTCGIVACVNVARLAGIGATEENTLEIAINNNLCDREKITPIFRKHIQGGGTTPKERKELLKQMGIESHLEVASINAIAKRVAEGRGVIVSVRSEKLWGDDNSKGLHAITVTSVMKNQRGEICGFFVCDSGTGGVDSAKFYTADELNNALTPKRPMNVTSNIIR